MSSFTMGKIGLLKVLNKWDETYDQQGRQETSLGQLLSASYLASPFRHMSSPICSEMVEPFIFQALWISPLLLFADKLTLFQSRGYVDLLNSP